MRLLPLESAHFIENPEVTPRNWESSGEVGGETLGDLQRRQLLDRTFSSQDFQQPHPEWLPRVCSKGNGEEFLKGQLRVLQAISPQNSDLHTHQPCRSAFPHWKKQHASYCTLGLIFKVGTMWAFLKKKNLKKQGSHSVDHVHLLPMKVQSAAKGETEMNKYWDFDLIF